MRASSRAATARSDLVGGCPRALGIHVEEQDVAAAGEKRPRRCHAVHARADHRGRSGGRASECLGRQHCRGPRAERSNGARVEHRAERPVRSVREEHEPYHRRQALCRVPRERRDPLQGRVAAAQRRHRAKVTGGVGGHVNLRRHRPLTPRVGHERVANRLEARSGETAASTSLPLKTWTVHPPSVRRGTGLISCHASLSAGSDCRPRGRTRSRLLASLEANAPTLVFASFKAIEPGASRGRTETVADLFLLRGNVITRRLTRTSQWEESPAWSRTVAESLSARANPVCHSNFCERRPIDGSIWVRRLNRGGTPDLLRTDSIDRSPVWSPDGKWIAFARVSCCEEDPEVDGIYRIRPDGTNQERIHAIRAYALDWSPDGSTIAFLSESGRVRLLDVESADAPRLLITNITGGKADIAGRREGSAGHCGRLRGIYVVRAEGGRPAGSQAEAGSNGEIAPSVSRSPDGRRLAFTTAISRAKPPAPTSSWSA